MWNPNSLNWPSWMNDYLVDGIASVLTSRNKEGTLPERFKKYLPKEALPEGAYREDVPTVRANVKAPMGFCMVESDYQTAEMRGLAYISEDVILIKLIEEPDACFAFVKPEKIPAGTTADDYTCRLRFPDLLGGSGGFDKYLMTYTSNGEVKARFTEDDLLRDENGNIMSPRYDMH